jgi:hypothetical protein
MIFRFAVLACLFLGVIRAASLPFVQSGENYISEGAPRW